MSFYFILIRDQIVSKIFVRRTGSDQLWIHNPTLVFCLLVQSKHRNSLFRYRSETTETNCFETNRKKRKTLNFLLKIVKQDPYQTVSVGLLFVSVSVQQRNNRNKRFVSDSAETSFVPVSVVSNGNQFRRTPQLNAICCDSPALIKDQIQLRK